MLLYWRAVPIPSELFLGSRTKPIFRNVVCIYEWLKLNCVNYFMCLFWLRWHSAVYKYIKLLIFYGLEGSNDVENVTQWFPNVVPWPIKSVLHGDLLHVHLLGSHPSPTEAETLHMGASSLCFTQVLWVILMHSEVWEPRVQKCLLIYIGFWTNIIYFSRSTFLINMV